MLRTVRVRRSTTSVLYTPQVVELVVLLGEDGRLLGVSRPEFGRVMRRVWPVSGFGLLLLHGVQVERPSSTSLATLEADYPDVVGGFRYAAEIRARLLVFIVALMAIAVLTRMIR